MKLSLINLKLNSVLIFSILLSISVGCNKEKPEPEPKELELPPATTSGNNTFGCKINGEVFVPHGNAFYKAINRPAYFLEDSVLGITARNIYDFENDFVINIYLNEPIFGPVIYENFTYSEILSIQEYGDSIVNGIETSFNRWYISDTTMYRKVEITRLDLSKGIASGLFEFTVIDQQSAKRISVTEGRFDLKGLNIQ